MISFWETDTKEPFSHPGAVNLTRGWSCAGRQHKGVADYMVIKSVNDYFFRFNSPALSTLLTILN